MTISRNDDPDYFPNTDYERGYADGQAARLSHDRGADALQPMRNRLTAGAIRDAPRGPGALLLADVDRIEAALSVPAPTLPALDVDVLEKALLAHLAAFIEQPESYENRHLVAESIAEHSATLRDAAPTEEERDTE